MPLPCSPKEISEAVSGSGFVHIKVQIGSRAAFQSPRAAQLGREW